MIIVPKSQIWTRQPTEPVEIDWSNPLAQGLAFASPLRPGVGMADLIQKQTPTWVGDSARGSNRYGEFAKTGSQYLSFAKQPQITHTQPCSITWIQEPSSVPGYHTAMEFNVGGGGAFVVGFQSTLSPEYRMVCGYRSGVSDISRWDDLGPPVVGVATVYTAVFPDGVGGSHTNCRLYRDGVGYARTGPVGLTSNNGGHFYIGARDGGYDPFYGLLGNVLIHGRALDEGEAKGLYDNPWQIYKRRSRHVFLEASGGGASAALTGSAISTAVGSLAVSITVPLSGNSLTSTSGALGPGLALGLSGSAENLNAGTVSCSVGLELSGNSQAFAFGTVTVSSGYFASLTGSEQIFSSGSLSPEIELALSGHSLGFAQGTVVVGASYIVALTGLGQTLSSGTLAPEIELSINGQAQTLAFGIFSPAIQTTLTGRSMTLTPGTLSIAGGSGGIGSLDPATIAAIAAAIWSDPRAPTIAKLLAIKDG